MFYYHIRCHNQKCAYEKHTDAKHLKYLPVPLFAQMIRLHSHKDAAPPATDIIANTSIYTNTKNILLYAVGIHYIPYLDLINSFSAKLKILRRINSAILHPANTPTTASIASGMYTKVSYRCLLLKSNIPHSQSRT